MSWFVRMAAVPALAVGVAAVAQDLPQVRYPALARAAPTAEGLVPSGWTVKARARGDLNRDGRPDAVLLMQMRDPRNIIPFGQGSAAVPLDTNPHMLIVAFAEPRGGYRLAASSHALFARPFQPYDGEEPLGSGTIGIARGMLDVRFFHLRGATSFRFRWDGSAMRLIGYENSGVSADCVYTTSINYLTGRAHLTASRMSEDRGRSAWRRLRTPEQPVLDRVDIESFLPLDSIVGEPLTCSSPGDG